MKELDNVPSLIVDKPSLPQTMAYTKEGKFRDISFWQPILGKKAGFNPLTVYTGTKTVYRDTTYTNSLVITYNVTGSYYKNVVTVGPTLKYWTAAGGSGEAVNGNSSGTTYVWEITTRYYNTNQCINPSTTSSYLKHSYDYVVTAYISVLGQGLIPYKDTRITGYQTYGVSYI